ncbi:hypothetical protein BC937DRAFT_86138 [Endogone sp. FLAS-F59071]|nr:hypothetical protein BC937DRAFT_86138 [Endogone sp. FLAS-F59071]|eukprot:RUS23453.1 hypothetical protein BC937DRAFT_86138 [Endogone sp. FLAS-F59071]
MSSAPTIMEIHKHNFFSDARDVIRQRILKNAVLLEKLKPIRQRLSPAHIGLLCAGKQLKSALLDSSTANMVKLIKTESAKGRYLVAACSIPSGSIILREMPYVSKLLLTYRGQFCDNCLREVDEKVQVRCNGCSVIYCSPNCEVEARAVGHGFLCGIDQSLFELVGDNGVSCIKTYLICTQPKEPAPTNLKNDISDFIEGIPDLVDNLHLRTPESIQSYLTTAIFLTTIFNLPSSIEPTLVKIQAQLACNIFGIKRLINVSDASVNKRDDVAVGAGVYLAASMMNHSCSPNAMAAWGVRRSAKEKKGDGGGIDMREMVVVMSREVRKGEPICISYGPQLGKVPVEERKRELAEKYFFDCECEVCRNINSNVSDQCYKCPAACRLVKLSAIDKVCPACKTLVDTVKRAETEAQANQLFQSESTHSVLKCLKMRQQIYSADAYILGATYDRLAELYQSKGLS